MNKKEIGLLCYGFFLIAYFGLSIMAFLGDPITAAGYFNDAYWIILGLVVGFILYAVYIIKNTEPKKKPDSKFLIK